MKNKQNDGMQGSTMLFKLSNYFKLSGYMLIALLVRIFAWSPVALLLITPVGWSIQWLSLLCPVLVITLVLPMRFSFAQAMMAAAQGGSFSIWRALCFSHYRKKLCASLLHALHIFCWGLPFMLILGWIYYVIFFMDAFTMMRMFSALGNGAALVLSKVVNLFVGIFGGNTVQWEGGFAEGLYLAAGFAVLALFIFIWGIWRCSLYRYLWAAGALRTRGSPNKLRNILHGYRWKQLFCGIYNLILWLPTLFFLFLVALSVQAKILDLVTLIFETKTFQPITFSKGEAVLCAIGLLCHILILPIRRKETSYLVKSIVQD